MLKELVSANRFEALWIEAASQSPADTAQGDRVHGLLAVLSRSGAPALEKIRAFLIALLETARAERIFLFDVPLRTAAEPPALGQCLASLDFDREPIREPESKVPLQFLKEILTEGQAVLLEDTGTDSRWQEKEGALKSQARSIAAIPLLARGMPVALVYLDHRFQAMHLDESAAAQIAALCHLLGILHQGEKTEGENRSLWQDVTRLKERAQQAAAQAPLAIPRPLSRTRVDRSHLKGNYSLIVGSSPPMMEIFQLMDRISGSNAPILINGESGTGKELIANAVHLNSPRGGKPFVSENCGALTETLLESELFGYVKGAFTGAGKDHKGLFELADSGSLFLDEVGDMSPTMQKKLLRVIQEGVIRRVGGKDYIKVDVRLICATNKDLLQECRQGNFREDLYYRLNVINIRMPVLRDRKEDIPELVEYFLAEMSRQAGVTKTIEPAALQRMVQHQWPGNIRELQNEVKRIFALSDEVIRITDLSDAILQGNEREFLHPGLEKELARLTLHDATEKLEKEMIRMALIEARGNKSLVAKKLEIPKTSLYNKISKYQLDRELPQ